MIAVTGGVFRAVIPTPADTYAGALDRARAASRALEDLSIVLTREDGAPWSGGPVGEVRPVFRTVTHPEDVVFGRVEGTRPGPQSLPPAVIVYIAPKQAPINDTRQQLAELYRAMLERLGVIVVEWVPAVGL